jgi:hypothetical protein
MNDDKECYIEYRHYGTTIRFSGLSREMDMEDFHTLCRQLAFAVGHHHTNVTEWFDPDEEYPEIVDNLQRKITSLEAENMRLNGIVHGMYT